MLFKKVRIGHKQGTVTAHNGNAKGTPAPGSLCSPCPDGLLSAPEGSVFKFTPNFHRKRHNGPPILKRSNWQWSIRRTRGNSFRNCVGEHLSHLFASIELRHTALELLRMDSNCQRTPWSVLFVSAMELDKTLVEAALGTTTRKLVVPKHQGGRTWLQEKSRHSSVAQCLAKECKLAPKLASHPCRTGGVMDMSNPIQRE